MFIPTSITVAPGFTNSRVIIPARPIAATRMSARRQTPADRACWEWQTVTVALPLISSMAAGLPTMSLRPTTTASCPAMGILLRFRISITPAGVQGTSPRPLGGKKSHVHGMKAVHIFRRIDRHQHFLRIDLLGQGQLDQDSVDLVAAVQFLDEIESSSVEMLLDGVSFSL